MVSINPEHDKYIITFKRKDLRPNKRDDKLEIFRNAAGLEEIRDVLDLGRYSGDHMTDTIRKTKTTVTDINSFQTPFIIAKLSPEQVIRLRKDPNIERVEEDAPMYPTAETTPYQVTILKAQTTWVNPYNIQGEGVNVAIIDDGRRAHPDYGTNVKVDQDFSGSGHTTPDGGNFHGTHVAGIIGAAAGNDIGIQGVAPKCNLWNLKFISTSGIVSDSIEAIQYATQNNAHVVNMSFGGTAGVQAQQDAITAGVSRGLIFVAAAGNNGKQELFYPAAYTGVLAISSCDKDKVASWFTNFGTYVDFTGPGSDVTSLGPDNGYNVLSGTSMASPAIAGVIALALSAYRDTGCPPYDPGSTKREVIEKIMRDTAARDLVGFTGSKDIKFGYGLPQADKIIAALKGVIPPVTPPGGSGGGGGGSNPGTPTPNNPNPGNPTPGTPGARPNPPSGGGEVFTIQRDNGQQWGSYVGTCLYGWDAVSQRWKLIASTGGQTPSPCVQELPAT